THIAISTRIWLELNKNLRLVTLVGFDFLSVRDRFLAEENKPRTKAQILELLHSEGEEFASWLETLTPEFLDEGVTDPDGKHARPPFDRILGPKKHKMHHRGQLMLINRQLGTPPPPPRQFNERVAQLRAARA